MNNFSTSRSLFSGNLSLNLNGRLLDLSTPGIMGIINATWDSFYEGNRSPDPVTAVEMAGKMIRHGADILDLGAVSSRPGAQQVSQEEELGRLLPVLEALRSEYPEFPISVDTWRSGVVTEAHKRFRIDMVNDISAGQLDPGMFSVIAETGLPYIMMHMQGTPDTMQHEPQYANVVDDLLRFFGERIDRLKKLGANDLVIDPGFGFGKTMEQNYTLLRELDAFRMLELPILVGISRKSMIYSALELNQDHALNGTTAAHMAALIKGANLLRVHDVEAAAETVKIFQHFTGVY